MGNAAKTLGPRLKGLFCFPRTRNPRIKATNFNQARWNIPGPRDRFDRAEVSISRVRNRLDANSILFRTLSRIRIDTLQFANINSELVFKLKDLLIVPRLIYSTTR